MPQALIIKPPLPSLMSVLQEWMAPYLRSCPKQRRRPASRPVTLLKTCGSPVSARTACVWSGTRVCSSTAAAGTPRAKARTTSVALRAAARATTSPTTCPKNSSAYGTRRPSILFWVVKRREILFFSLSPEPSQCFSTLLFKVNTVTLDLGLDDVK